MNKYKKKVSILLLVTMLIFMLSGCGKSVVTENKGSSEYRVCMVTDSGDITDQSFNQTTYEASRDYCKVHDIDFTYKKPDGDTDYDRTAMIDVAVAEGYNILVLPGYLFAQTVVDTSFKYPDIKFVVLDMGAGDICAAAVGNAYYDDPDAYNVADYYNTKNTCLTVYQESIPGYLAGYTVVKLGYRHLGFLGGQAVPGVMKYGYGYLQGINAAAEEMGITDEVTVEYAYSGQFYGSAEITAVMDTWYSNGTEIVFACGGSNYASVAEAAVKVGGKVIGVDSDQAPIIDRYEKGMTVTSAMKGLTTTVNAILDSIIYDGTWEEHVGKVESLGLVSKDDMSLNYVGLPEDSTQWNENFTLEDYRGLVADIYDGKIQVSNDITQMPEVSVKLKVRQGTIK